MNRDTHQGRGLRRRAALGLLAGAALAPLAGLAQGRAQEDNQRFLERAFARWAAGGKGFFDEVLDQDVVWTIKGSGPSAGVYRGKRDFLERAVRPFALRMAQPVRPVSWRLWAQGETVVAQWDGRGVAGDGQPYANSYVWIFRLRAGKAVEVSAWLDLPAYDEVLRRVPAPGA
jgi:hypothetical protein